MSSQKKTKLFNSRAIRTQLADPAYTDGVLAVPDFLRAREFEIRAFELSQLNTKYASSTRVFQKLPRVLRRRAASHNVRRVPKRLRRRALREMASESAAPKRATGKSVYHAKMTSRLLRLATRLKAMGQLPADAVYDHAKIQNRIKEAAQQLKRLKEERSPHKLNNVVGSYDSTGIDKLAERPRGKLKYFKRQKDFVWLPTHVWHAKRCHMIKRWGYQIPLSPTQKCFRATNRASKQESVMFDASYYGILIVDCVNATEVTNLYSQIVKRAPTTKILQGRTSYYGSVHEADEELGPGMVYCNVNLRKILVRVHPAIYEQLFNFLLIIKQEGTRLQDCRYSLGSIELVGPKSLNALNKVFHTIHKSDLWTNLLRYNEQNVPSGTTFSFNIKDPRLYEKPVTPPVKKELSFNDLLVELNSTSTVDNRSLEILLAPDARNETYKDQLSNKVLHRIKGNKSLVQANATEIPVLLTKFRKAWCLIIPWFWVLPVWLQLHKINSIKLGGLKQAEQINFENYLPSFPLDYPYLKTGWHENQVLAQVNQEKHRTLPKSKAPPYDRIEQDSPFGCDWEFLRNITVVGKQNPELENDKRFGDFKGIDKEIHTQKDLIEFCNAMKTGELPVTIGSGDCASTKDKLPVKQVWVTLTSGSLRDSARICHYDSALLIGYVIRGTINLNNGKATGIGYIRADYNGSQVKIRNVGSTKSVVGTVILEKST